MRRKTGGTSDVPSAFMPIKTLRKAGGTSDVPTVASRLSKRFLSKKALGTSDVPTVFWSVFFVCFSFCRTWDPLEMPRKKTCFFLTVIVRLT